MLGKLKYPCEEGGLEKSGRALDLKYKNSVHQRERKKEETDNQRKRQQAWGAGKKRDREREREHINKKERNESGIGHFREVNVIPLNFHLGQSCKQNSF